MSVAFNGEYSVDIFNPSKRYMMQYQKGVALGDSELRELNEICYSLTRQLVYNNMGNGSSTNDGFKVEQSGGTSTNNFTIKGGDGTVNGAGVLFVDGYILFLRSDIEYNEQDDTGTIVDDDFTETAIPALTTPSSGARTDEVYVDMYFAEVSADLGSEYQDTDLMIAGVGSATANRVRQVQDIRVAQGTTTPASGADLNGIYHWRTKIATLERLNGNSQILTAMITDNRKIITSMGSLSSFNPEQILFGSAIGTLTQDTLFVRDAATGNVGIGTANPVDELHVNKSQAAPTQIRITNTSAADGGLSVLSLYSDTVYGVMTAHNNAHTTNTELTGKVLLKANTNSSALVLGAQDPAGEVQIYSGGLAAANRRITVDSDGHVGIGKTNPTIKLQVVDGTTDALHTVARFGTNNNGTNTGVSLQFVEDEDGTPVEIGRISSYHSGDLELNTAAGNVYMLNANLGIGTADPQERLHVLGNIVGNDNDSSSLGSAARRFANLYMASNIDYGTTLRFKENTTETVTFLTGGNVGIGSAIPAVKLDVVGAANISTNLVVGGNLEVNGTTTTLNTEVTTADMLSISQDDNQTALLVQQVGVGTTATTVRIENAGDGSALTTDNGTVGFGTGAPSTDLELYRSGNSAVFMKVNNPSNGSASEAGYILTNASATGTLGVYDNGHATTEYQDKVVLSSADDIALVSSSESIQMYTGGNDLANRRMTISSTGLVGIGSTVPSQALDIASGDDVLAKFRSTDDLAMIHVRDDDSSAYVGTSNSHAFLGQTASLSPNNLNINAIGHVGIGTIAPNTTFNIQSAASSTVMRLNCYSATDANSGRIIFEKSASDTKGTLVATALNDSFGEFLFYGTDSGSTLSALSSFINIGQDDTAGATYVPSSIQFGTGTNAAVAVERMRIASTGFVGIGTATPQTKLHVYGSSIVSQSATSPYIGALRNAGNAITMAINNTSGAWNWTQTAAGDGIIQSTPGNKMHVGVGTSTSGTPTMTFVASGTSGKVGIGTTNPANTLSVHGNMNINTSNVDGNESRFVFTSGGSGDDADMSMYKANASTIGVRLDTNGVSYFNGGNVGIGSAIPTTQLEVRDNVNGNTQIRVSNNTAGASSLASLSVQANASEGFITAFPASYTDNTQYANKVVVGTETNAGALMLLASASAGEVQMYTGGVGAAQRRMTILSTGAIGIGVASPTSLFHVKGQAVTEGDARSVMKVEDNRPMAPGVGGGIAFNGIYQSAGSLSTPFGTIWAEKENATNGNSAGQLHLAGRSNGTTPTSDVIINSNGQVGIGSAPLAGVELHVYAATHANAYIQGGGSNGNLAGLYLRHGNTLAGQFSSSLNDIVTFGSMSGGGNLEIKAGGTTAMTINSSTQHVGIATAPNVAFPLEVHNTSGYAIRCQSDDGGAFVSYSVNGGVAVNCIGKFEASLTSELSGNVGIGTTSSTYALHVLGGAAIEHANAPGLDFKTSGANRGQIWATTASSFSVYATSGNALNLGSNGSQTIKCSTGNDVGIGTGTPVSKLNVWESGTASITTHGTTNVNYWLRTGSTSGGYVGSLSATATSVYVGSAGGSSLPFNIKSHGSTAIHCTVGQDVGIGTETPASRLHIRGATVYVGQARATYRCEDTTAMAQGVGAGFLLGGMHTGSSSTAFAGIWCQKENATSGNYAGELHFGTRQMSSTISNDMEIYSNGNVHVVNTFTAGIKSFSIDHPLDPENKVLNHSCIESPEMRNVYYGQEETVDGSVTISLPDWWHPLNGEDKSEYTYQLTTIGKYCQLYISQEIENGQFTVSSVEGDCKFSWTVTAIRHDAFAEDKRMVVEEEKPEGRKGKLIYERTL